jgi:AcrR family transcriptional regulator
MARIVKEEEYTGKRNAILDTAQRLIYSKGYEQMTIQDMLDDLQISKGAFYHYFDSKQAVLEALVERLGQGSLQLLVPIVNDPALPALDKFQRYIDVGNRWKVEQKAFFLALLRVWFTDENAVVRQKLRAIATREIAPLLARIIRQGVQEGVMRASYPEQMGEVLAALAQDAGEALGTLMISFDPPRVDMQRAERTVAAYTEAFERVLGVPAGSLTLIDDQTLKEWFASPVENEVEMKS